MYFELQWYELGRDIEKLKQRIEKSGNSANVVLRQQLQHLSEDMDTLERGMLGHADRMSQRLGEFKKKYGALVCLYKKAILRYL